MWLCLVTIFYKYPPVIQHCIMSWQFVITLPYLLKMKTTKPTNSYIEIMYEFVITIIEISSMGEITMMYFSLIITTGLNFLLLHEFLYQLWVILWNVETFTAWKFWNESLVVLVVKSLRPIGIEIYPFCHWEVYVRLRSICCNWLSH